MKFRILGFVPALLFIHSAWAEVKGPAWLSDPQHPLLQYRFNCVRGSETLVWRNGYPGAVTLKARVKSFTYDGVEDVQIEPGATTNTEFWMLSSVEISRPPLPTFPWLPRRLLPLLLAPA